MPNFELIDNFFQVTVLGFTAFIALILAYLHKSRRCLILSLAYACFFMGTLYYVLCLCITGDVPQVFYVAEISWIASYFFFFSLQIVRTENIRLHFSPIPALCSVFIAATILIFRFAGPSYLVSGLFAIPTSGIMYLSVFRLQCNMKYWLTDFCFVICIILQVLLYIVSMFIKDYTRFNLYFAIDISLTISLVTLLVLNLQEVIKNDIH